MRDIFKDEQTEHGLTLFNKEEITELEERLFEKNGRPYIRCLASDKDRPAKPEEIVRQLWIRKLMTEFDYQKERIKVEHPVWFGSAIADKSADIIVMHKDDEAPYIIFEVKKPKRKDGEQQLKSYCNAEGSPIGVWSNGEELVILKRDEPNTFTSISSIPRSDETLQDIIQEQWTINKLKQENKLVREKLSLKKIILDLEDLVLANAEGVDDSFDEMFKLIYAKLYDEWAATNIRSEQGKIHFRIYGESHKELRDKINNLFRKAKQQWRGVFAHEDVIKLQPSHLRTCVSFLQDVKLFNANLQIIDEAFEYLITEVAKGKKGQYFTPRWVIDACVKKLNPKINERLIDPACGSSGFTVHSIFWIADQQFTDEGFSPRVNEYAHNNVYNIDSSPRAVKISKALNLIVGDGKSNIYELNSLNPVKWHDEGKSAFRNFRTRFMDDLKDDENERSLRYLDFDILMTNPPFAGNINEREILKQYRLAEKNGRTVQQVGRDILFIERSLNLIRSGGRMAIVLPQGRLNNTSDLYIRKFIFDKAKILAVLSLHVNTFKPHTGTKTSVLFLQKYTEEELDKIHQNLNYHAKEWDKHVTEIRSLSERDLVEENVSPVLLTYLDAEFGEEDLVDGNEDSNNTNKTKESSEDLVERITDLETQLSNMRGKAAGKAELVRAISESKRKLASQSIKGKLQWLIGNDKMLERYREIWLSARSIGQLDYPIFFAISERVEKIIVVIQFTRGIPKENY